MNAQGRAGFPIWNSHITGTNCQQKPRILDYERVVSLVPGNIAQAKRLRLGKGLLVEAIDRKASGLLAEEEYPGLGIVENPGGWN